MPFSQIIPPSLSPTGSKRLFYIPTMTCLLCSKCQLVVFASNQFSCPMGSDSTRFPQEASSSPRALVPFDPSALSFPHEVGAACASASGGVSLPPSPCCPISGTRTVTDPSSAGWDCLHHRVSDAIQPSHPLSSPFPPAPNPSQHQSLFQ